MKPASDVRRASIFLAIRDNDVPTIIALLNSRVQSSDTGDHRTDRDLVAALREAGWRHIDELTATQKKGATPTTLARCIVGNYIAADDRVPPNVMTRYCELYARLCKQERQTRRSRRGAKKVVAVTPTDPTLQVPRRIDLDA